jgi:hypothetical protein
VRLGDEIRNESEWIRKKRNGERKFKKLLITG